jgi:negative regulator of flagellin synthesis FlgM
MKIGHLESKPATPAITSTAAERKPAQPIKAPPDAAGAEPSTQVDLSSTAASLSGMSSDPTFDASKVDRISQAIRDGKFKVNPEAIADKLILNAEELLGRKLSN